MIKEKLGKDLDRWIHAAFPFLFKRSLNPNLLTLLGTAISVVAAGAFAQGHLRTGALVMLAGGFFDLVDGVVARHFGTSTSFGAFLDSTLDRFVDMAVMLGLLIHYGAQAALVPQLLAGVVLVSSILTSYAKARAELMIPHLPGGMLERGERVGILAAGGFFGVMVPALWVLAIGTTWTAVQRIVSAYHELEGMDAAARTAGERP
ncbi:MAG: CDP-alcohol phosphatidyltransferase family protein [Myxococcota bacterium]|nr:CDP-alcohol phosphatidyltransferase family protein [Myxococcota bacterium]